MVTKMRNDITNFRQEPDESLFEAWERYKLSIDRCPNHNMLPVTQIDTFYNGLTLRHRDTINAAAGATVGQTQNVYAAGAYNQGGNSYQPQGNRNLLSYRSDNYLGPSGFNVNQNQNRSNQNQNYQNRNQGNNHQGNNQGRNQFFEGASCVQNPPPAYQAPPYQAPVHQAPPNPKLSIMYPSRRNNERRHEKANDQIEKFYEIFKDLSFEISLTDALILMPKFASTLKALIGNKEKLSEMARTPLNEHCSAVILNKLPEKLGDLGKFLIPRIAEDVYVKVGKFQFLDDFVVIAFDADPRVPLILGRSFLKTGRVLIDVYEGELTLRVGKEAVTLNLDQTSRYSANYNDMTANRIDAIEMACEEYSQEVLGFSNVIASGNPTPYYDPIVSTSSPTLTPFGDSDFLLEEVDAFFALEDDPTSPEVDHSYYDSEGDILLLEAFLNDDPSLPPPTQGNYLPKI
ncbi:reverse transcriptase domain-containing protein [Tanacetum coccineum]